jgi:hypothetical protein
MVFSFYHVIDSASATKGLEKIFTVPPPTNLSAGDDMGYVQFVPIPHFEGQLVWRDPGIVEKDVQTRAQLVIDVEKLRLQPGETLNQCREARHDRISADIVPAYFLGVRLQERRNVNLNTCQPIPPRLS